VYRRSASLIVPTGIWTTNQMANVKINSIFFEDISLQSTSDITSAWTTGSCQTTFYDNSPHDVTDLSSFCSFSSSSTKTLLTASSSPALCLGIVKSVSYSIHHDASSTATINSIIADVILTDIPMTSGIDVSISFHQSFAVKYASTNSASLSSENGNQVIRERSGNPGYQMGKPVLYGFLNGSSVINELISGLTVPVAGSSNVCPTNPSQTAKTTTSFGYDSITGCSMNFNRQELINFCCSGAPGSCLDNSDSSVTGFTPFSASSGHPFFLNFTQGLVFYLLLSYFFSPLLLLDMLESMEMLIHLIFHNGFQFLIRLLRMLDNGMTLPQLVRMSFLVIPL
jgi:hypothetical protein